jgi:hypothetical protein
MKTRRAQSARHTPALLAAPALASLLLLTSCGGGGGFTPLPKPPQLPSTLMISTASLPGGISGQEYSQTLQATGGEPPYSWGLAADSEPLPPGLSLSVSGVISGVPEPTPFAAAGAGQIFWIKVQATDSQPKTSSRSFELVIYGPLMVVTTSLSDGNVGLFYQDAIRVSGGQTNYTITLLPTSQSVPAGLTFTSDGTFGWFRGVPTEYGTFHFSVSVQDSGNPQQTTTGDVSLTIQNGLVVTSDRLTLGVVNQPYSDQISVAGGTPPYSYGVGWGSPPPGVGLDSSTGVVSGIPTSAGLFDFEVVVEDSASPPNRTSRSIRISIDPALGFSGEPLYDGVVGRGYYYQIPVYGGIPPYTVHLASGSLPPGITLPAGSDNRPQFSGAPTSTGDFHFTLEAADSSNPPAGVQGSLRIRVSEPLTITTTSLPSGMTGDPYDFTLSGSGGFGPYEWSVGTSPGLPSGLALEPTTGHISGIPTQPYDAYIGFGLRDSSNPPQSVYSISFPLKIVGRLDITSSRLPPTHPNAPYRISLGLFGGTPPYAWSITSGALPSGLSLGPSTGTITGTPTTAGTSNFTVQVTDTGPPVQTASTVLSLTIRSNLGRNDSPATATPISNGTFRASISPYSDPVDGPAFPDNDYYALTASPGAIVTLETMADRLTPASPLDSVIEIVDADGHRFTTCRPGNDTYGSYNQACLNDDFDWYNTLDSKLEFQVPSTGPDPVTFYVHVLDWSGSARPDFVYDLIVSGAN